MVGTSTWERLVWTLISAAGTAAGAYLTEVLVARGWKHFTGRRPPRALAFVGAAGGSAGRTAAAKIARWSGSRVH